MNMDPSQKVVGSVRAGGRSAKTSSRLKDSVHGGALEAALASPVASASFSGKVKETPVKLISRMESLEELLKKEVHDINTRIENSMEVLRKQIDQGLKGGTSKAGNVSASDDELQNKVDILEKKLDDLNKTLETKMEGLIDIIKCSLSEQGNLELSEDERNMVASGALDGNNIAVNNSSAAQSKMEIIENRLSHVDDDLTSIKDSLSNINTKLQINNNNINNNNIASSSFASAVTQSQGQGRVLPQVGVHRQSADRYGNRDDEFLNRLRQDKARFMIVFGIVEEEFEGVNDMDQKCVDRHTIGEILEDMKQKDLIMRVITTQRLGSKSEGRIRPIRVEFDSAMSRETACRNARELKNSIRYKNVASIARDKTREDRERDKIIYLANKHQRSLSGPGSVGAPTGSGTPTAAEIDNRHGSVDTERDQQHPQMASDRLPS